MVQKVFEPLNAMLEAFEARLKTGQTLEERARTYPDPVIESRRLDICQKLIEVTQALLQQQTIEGQINASQNTKIPENGNSNQKECVLSSELHKDDDHEITNHTPEPIEKEPKELDTRIVPDSDDLGTMGVPEVRDDWPNELWEAKRNAKDGSLTLKSAPLETVFEHPFIVEKIWNLFMEMQDHKRQMTARLLP